MNKRLIGDGLGWGFILWLIGYFLSIVLFMFVPPELLGWVITPFGITITVWVLLRKIKEIPISHYLSIGIIWTLIAAICDYLFIVLLFKPEDGYYKLDIYLYYLSTFALPLIVGWYKSKKKLTTGEAQQ